MKIELSPEIQAKIDQLSSDISHLVPKDMPKVGLEWLGGDGPWYRWPTETEYAEAVQILRDGGTELEAQQYLLRCMKGR